MRTVVFLIALAGTAVLAGCGSNSSSPTIVTSSAPFSATDLAVGTGAAAATGNFLTVNYTGWLYDTRQIDGKGQQFDSSLTAGRSPFQFTLGGNVIQGWNQGLVGMKVGGKRRLIIPPDLAYGPSGSPPAIPPNATLIFDIDLLNVQ
jgi:FKBP-type peptidyl-prolyl cis-trans isomerase FkpA